MALAPPNLSLELRNVSLRFGPEWIFKNIDLKIQKAELIVILGPSGQGKSTLLKLLCGLISPTEGEVWIESHNFHKTTDAIRQELLLKMGMLFQKNALFDSISCFENVAFPLREVTKLSESEILDRAGHYLEAVGLAAAKNLMPHEISGGMQKRLGIARALALNPQIIFYDDPTAGLDPITSRKIIELILKLQSEQKSTLVTITNDVNRAYQLADRMMMVLNQEIVDLGSPQEAKSSKDPRVIQFLTGALNGPLSEAASL